MTLIEQIKDLVNRVENGDMTAENARNFTGEEGKWVTIKGTHVFIPEGQEVDEVIKEKFGETEEKTDKKEEKKSYLDKIKEERKKECKKDIQKFFKDFHINYLILYISYYNTYSDFVIKRHTAKQYYPTAKF